MSLLPFLSLMNLYPNGWFGTERRQRHRPRCENMQSILGMRHVRCCGWPVVARYGIIVTAAHFHLSQRFLGSKNICALNAD